MNEREREDRVEHDRRTFLNTFGKAAIVAPPVITMMLSTSMASPAIAASTGGTSGGDGTDGGETDSGGDPTPVVTVTNKNRHSK